MNYYQIILTKGDPIIIDQIDYKKLVENLSESFVKMKKGVVNPSFIVSIYPISEKRALEGETVPREDGYLDEERGVYVVNKPKDISIKGLRDEFIER